MPIKNAAFKALRQSKTRRARNQTVLASLKNLLKQSRLALKAKDMTKLESLTKETARTLDRAAQKGVIKKNTASRKKSRLVKSFQKLKKATT
jgi:small subunit ribosomal protein S20